jgi:acyl dehydratase
MTTLTLPVTGETLTPKVVVPTTTDLVRFAGASSDYNLIHYDHHYATTRGFTGVIVHGFFKAAFLAELAFAHAPADSWFRSLSATYRGVDRVGRPIVLEGSVVDVDSGRGDVTYDLTTTNSEGQVTTTCRAVIAWNTNDEGRAA